MEGRVEIRVGLGAGESMGAIAARLGRASSTISREVAANGGPDTYRPVAAQLAAMVAARRPKATKLGSNPVLCRRVIADLERWWSPEQITARLGEESATMTPCAYRMRPSTSPCTCKDAVGCRELARCLRTGRAVRKPQGGTEKRGQIVDKIMIRERPAEVEDRAIPGHWEGDLIIGKNSRSAIGTMVERTTRFTLLLHLPDDHTAETVRAAMTAKIVQLPTELARSVTWDQGAEMAGHARFSVDTGIEVYFCDPHSRWQRGSNENTNGLLRQYFPKGTDLSVQSPEHFDTVAASLNGRPRRTLGWMTPSEKLDQLLIASTA